MVLSQKRSNQWSPASTTHIKHWLLAVSGMNKTKSSFEPRPNSGTEMSSLENLWAVNTAIDICNQTFFTFWVLFCLFTSLFFHLLIRSPLSDFIAYRMIIINTWGKAHADTHIHVYSMDIPQLGYLFISWWAFGCFHVLALMSEWLWTCHIKDFVTDMFHVFLYKHLGLG